MTRPDPTPDPAVDPGDLVTLSIHAGEEASAPSLAPDICVSTSFAVDPDAVGFSASDLTDDAPFFYTRWANPTVRQLERKLAALDGGEDAVCFGSGMGAITGLLLGTLSAGDHLVISNVAYAGTAELVHDTLPRFGIAVSPVDTSDPDAVADAITPSTRLIYAETPANPILRLTDIAALARLAGDAGCKLAVDSTLATPVATRPLALGADYVIHSLTKYACGHGGDALGGVVIGAKEAMAALRQGPLIHLGGTLSPFHAWIILRSLHTLEIRMAAHQRGALAVADFLAGHDRVSRVLYPGHPSHPQHALACRQMANFSGMVSFVAEDGAALARTIAHKIRVFAYAVSMGKSKSLIFHIPTDDLQRTSFRMTGADLARYRDWAGDGVFRLSIGLESPETLVADLDRTLS